MILIDLLDSSVREASLRDATLLDGPRYLGIQCVVVSGLSERWTVQRQFLLTSFSRARTRVDHDRLKERIRIVLAAALTKRTINDPYLLPA